MMEITRQTYIESLNRLANTEDGQIVLAAIMNACGWEMTALDSDSENRTLMMATKRGVYGSIRKDIQREFFKKIEYDYMVVAEAVRKKAPKDGKG